MITFVCAVEWLDRMWNVAESKIPNRLLHDKTETKLMPTSHRSLHVGSACAQTYTRDYAVCRHWLLCFFTATTRHHRLAPILSCSLINPYLCLSLCVFRCLVSFLFSVQSHTMHTATLRLECWTVDRLIHFGSLRSFIHSFIPFDLWPFAVWIFALWLDFDVRCLNAKKQYVIITIILAVKV